MLLAQIVAVSFASNLSFLAILLSPASLDSKEERRRRRRQVTNEGHNVLVLGVILMVYTSVAMIPALQNHSLFMVDLLMPHVLVFAPIFLAKSDSQGLLSPYWLTVFLAAALELQTTMKIFRQDGGLVNVFEAFHEHPATSSVGWDVIMCWISFTAWYFARVK